MASVKVSGLTAGTTPTSYSGLVLVSVVGAPFDSRKFTLDQLQEIMLENPNTRSLVLGTPGASAKISATSSDFELYNTDSKTFYLVNDGNGGDFTDSWMFGDAGTCAIGNSQLGGANGNSFSAETNEITMWQNNLQVFGVRNAAGGILSGADHGSGGVCSSGLTWDGATFKNAFAVAGDSMSIDQQDTCHVQALSKKINDLGSVGINQTLTISDGAHVKLTPTTNITINVNTTSTANSVNWTLEVDNAGGHTITQGTGFVNTASGTWAVFGTGLEVLTMQSLISGSHLVNTQLPTVG